MYALLYQCCVLLVMNWKQREGVVQREKEVVLLLLLHFELPSRNVEKCNVRVLEGSLRDCQRCRVARRRNGAMVLSMHALIRRS